MSFDISMKFFSRFRMLAMLAAALMAIGTRAEAQALAMSASTSTNLVVVSNSVTYTISVTNLTSSVLFAFVTNTFPSTAQLMGASINPNSGTTVTNANGFSFNNIPLAGIGTWVQMTVTAVPTQLGVFTNTITVFVSGVTNATANAVTVVTNAPPTPPPTQADLAVAMTGPPSLFFSNDWMTYGVNVTNLGPASAPNVMLTNALVTGVQYISVLPSSLSPIFVGSNVIFNLGTLASNAFINVQLTVQPTITGTLPFSSFVNSTNVTDPNTANNTATINITVSNFLSNPGQLTATIVSPQKFNPQNSLMEQLIVVSNAGPSSVPAARVMVVGLTNLYNAVGINNGNPFVVYDAMLDATQSVSLLLQYFVPSHRTFPDPPLQAVGVTLPDLSPPANLSTNIHILGIARLYSGGMLIAFPSVSNLTYTVEYTTNLLSTNWLATQPAVTATANFTQCIDYGPPGTVSHPTNTTLRFYRVFLNP